MPRDNVMNTQMNHEARGCHVVTARCASAQGMRVDRDGKIEHDDISCTLYWKPTARAFELIHTIHHHSSRGIGGQRRVAAHAHP